MLSGAGAPGGTGIASLGVDDAPGHVYDVGVCNTPRGRRGEVPDLALYGTALGVARLLRALPDAPGLERWKGAFGQSVCGGLGHLAVRSGDLTAVVLSNQVSLDRPAWQVLSELSSRFGRALAPEF